MGTRVRWASTGIRALMTPWRNMRIKAILTGAVSLMPSSFSFVQDNRDGRFVDETARWAGATSTGSSNHQPALHVAREETVGIQPFLQREEPLVTGVHGAELLAVEQMVLRQVEAPAARHRHRRQSVE